MIEPFYDADGITIFNGDCLEVMPHLEKRSVQLVCTDPPYFKVKAEWWDHQWENPGAFLDWFHRLSLHWFELLALNGSFYVFASPQMAWDVERKVRERFNVLNRITWRKSAGRHDGCDKSALRSFFPQTETIIFAEHWPAVSGENERNAYQEKCDTAARDVFGHYIRQVRERHGLTMKQLTAAVGAHGKVNNGGACSNWERGYNVPTPLYYDRLQETFPGCFDRSYFELKYEYECRREEYETARRPFQATPRRPFTDVWDFDPVKPSKHKHSCQKPAALLEHIVLTSTREGDTVLDTFGGSMTLARICRDHGRRFIGIEIEKHWCEQAVCRLAQKVLFKH